MEKLGLMPPRRRFAGDEVAATLQPQAGELTAVLPREVRLAGDAAFLEAEARLKRSQANSEGCPEQAATLRREADERTTAANQVRSMAQTHSGGLSVGRGGEISGPPRQGMPVNVFRAAEMVQKPPDTLDAEASLVRLDLAQKADVLTTAVATAESVGARSAVEQMMAHQHAAAHSVAMRLMAASANALSRHESERLMGNMAFLTEATRSSAAAARLMDSCTRNASTLDRIRNGGRQHVTVQHVHVSDGGQAVVAGSMGALGKPRREQGGAGET